MSFDFPHRRFGGGAINGNRLDGNPKNRQCVSRGGGIGEKHAWYTPLQVIFDHGKTLFEQKDNLWRWARWNMTLIIDSMR